jgi:hypothetical protein
MENYLEKKEEIKTGEIKLKEQKPKIKHISLC